MCARNGTGLRVWQGSLGVIGLKKDGETRLGRNCAATLAEHKWGHAQAVASPWHSLCWHFIDRGYHGL